MRADDTHEVLIVQSQLMQALVIDAADAPFRRVTVDRPIPGAGQVLVQVHASAVSPFDVKIRRG